MVIFTDENKDPHHYFIIISVFGQNPSLFSFGQGIQRMLLQYFWWLKYAAQPGSGLLWAFGTDGVFMNSPYRVFLFLTAKHHEMFF